MRGILPVAVIVLMAALFGRAAALLLDDALIGAMAGVMVFLPLIVMAGPFLERATAPARIRRS